MARNQKSGDLARIGLFMALAHVFGAAAANAKYETRKNGGYGSAHRAGARGGNGSGGTGEDRGNRNTKNRAGFKLAKKMYRNRGYGGALVGRTRRKAVRKLADHENKNMDARLQDKARRRERGLV